MNRSIAALALLLGLALPAPGHSETPLEAWTWGGPDPEQDVKRGEFFLRDMGPRGDGLVDLVLVDHDTGEIHVRRQTPKGMAPGDPERHRIPAEAWLYDIGDLDGRAGEEILCFFRDGAAHVFDLDSEETRKLFAFDGDLTFPHARLDHSDVLVDFNGDGLLDILTPGGQTYDWRVQVEPGRFVRGARLPAPREVEADFRAQNGASWAFASLWRGKTAGGYQIPGFVPPASLADSSRRPVLFGYSRRELGQFLRMTDLNGDGRLDVTRPIAQHQTPEGGFEAVGSDATSEPDAFEKALGKGEKCPNCGKVHGMVRTDIDGDGRLDAYALEHETSGWRDFRLHLAVRMASADGQSVALRQDQSFNGLPWGGDPLTDLDGDGALDLVLLQIKFDIASANSTVKAYLFGKGLEAEAHVRFWRPGQGYPSKPDTRRRIRLVGDPGGLFDARPIFRHDADLTGDGFLDLLVRDAPDRLTLIPYDPKTKSYARRSAGALPLPGELARHRGVNPDLRDLNGDGKADLIAWLRDADDPDSTRLFLAVLR